MTQNPQNGNQENLSDVTNRIAFNKEDFEKLPKIAFNKEDFEKLPRFVQEVCADHAEEIFPLLKGKSKAEARATLLNFHIYRDEKTPEQIVKDTENEKVARVAARLQKQKADAEAKLVLNQKRLKELVEKVSQKCIEEAIRQGKTQIPEKEFKKVLAYELSGVVDGVGSLEKAQKALETTTGELTKRVTEAEKVLDNKTNYVGELTDKLEETQKALKKKIRKLRKQPHYKTKVGLVAVLATLGTLGLYSLTQRAKQYDLIELTRDRHGPVLVVDGREFYRNPLDRNDQRFYPANVIENLEEGQVPSSKTWIRFRTRGLEGGADVNLDGQKDLIDSKGNTYLSHPGDKRVFMSRERLHKELLR